MAKMIVVMLLFSLFVANLQSVSVGHAQVDTTATIAAWNIKGLDVDPISVTRAKQIAKGIALLDPGWSL